MKPNPWPHDPVAVAADLVVAVVAEEEMETEADGAGSKHHRVIHT